MWIYDDDDDVDDVDDAEVPMHGQKLFSTEHALLRTGFLIVLQ